MRRIIRRYICLVMAATTVTAGIAGCAAFTGYTSISNNSKEPAPVKVQESSGSEDTQDKYDITQPSALESSGNIGDLKYELANASADGGTAERGYYVFDNQENELPYVILIESGERSTGGYDINIADIQYDGTNLNIIVQETSPGPDDVVTAALTYPCCGIRLSILPDSISIKDMAGNEFQELYVALSEDNIDDGWIACLSDGAGEIVEKTYVYELDDGTYKYINVESVTTSWGSTQWNDTVKGSGTANSRDDVAKVAEEFGSCGWVTLPGDYSTVYSIDEFIEGKIFG